MEAQAQAMWRAARVAFSRAVGLKPLQIEHLRHGSSCFQRETRGFVASCLPAAQQCRLRDERKRKLTKHGPSFGELPSGNFESFEDEVFAKESRLIQYTGGEA